MPVIETDIFRDHNILIFLKLAKGVHFRSVPFKSCCFLVLFSLLYFIFDLIYCNNTILALVGDFPGPINRLSAKEMGGRSTLQLCQNFRQKIDKSCNIKLLWQPIEAYKGRRNGRPKIENLAKLEQKLRF